LSAVPLAETEAAEAADPPAEPPPRATLLNVQALRALAAFMVVCVHIQALAVMAGVPPGVTEAGNAGVDLFFVISGFIMVFTTGRKPMGPATFFGARLRRIAPLYWSVTLAVFLVARLAPSLVQNTPTDVGRLLASILFLPELRPDGTMRPVVFVGWTLNFEMAFYVLFALGLFARRRWLGVLGTVAALIAAVAWGQAARPAEPVLRFYTTPMALEFALGMLLGLAWPRLRPPPWAVWPLVLAGVAAFALMLAGPELWPGVDRLIAFGLPAGVIVAACLMLERQGWAIRWRWVKALGAASYAIYLSHFFVTQAVILGAHKAHLQGPLAAAVAAAVAFVGVAVAGLILHRNLEQGADRLIGWLMSRGQVSVAASPAVLPKAKSVY
jgi:exopolysaccharide production protein ExoZ